MVNSLSSVIMGLAQILFRTPFKFYLALFLVFGLRVRGQTSGENCPCPCADYQDKKLLPYSQSTCFSDIEKLRASLPVYPADGNQAKIRFQFLTWSSQWISSFIVGIITKEILNFKLEWVCASSGNNANARISNGHADACIEFWYETYYAQALEYISQKQTVVDLGDLGYPARAGVYIPTYTSELYLSLPLGSDSFKAYVSRGSMYYEAFTLPEVVALYASQNDTEVIQGLTQGYSFTPPWCNPWNSTGFGNNCIDIKGEKEYYDTELHQIIFNLKLNMTVSYWGISGMETYTQRKIKRREPVVFKYWIPEPFMSVLDYHRILFPEYSQECHLNNTRALTGSGSVDCDFPGVSLKKLSSKRIVTDDVNSDYFGFKSFMRRVDIPETEMDKLLQEVKNGTYNEYEAACNWLKDSTAWWNWIPEQTCKIGEVKEVGGACMIPSLSQDFNYISTGVRYFTIFLASIVFILAVIFATWTFVHSATPIILASQPLALYQMCFGAVISTSSTIFSGMDDREYSPSMLGTTCNLSIWLWGLGFAITYTGMLTKLWKVQYLLNSAVNKLKVSQLTNATTALIMIAGILVEGLVLGIWSIVDGFKWKRTCLETDAFGRCAKSTGFCHSDNTLSILVPLFSLHLLSMAYALVLCFKSRNIPSVLSETAWITTAMIGNFQICFMGGFLLYTLREDPTFFHLIFSFFVVLSDGSVISLIFFPKFYAIHFQNQGDFKKTATMKVIGDRILEAQKNYTEQKRLSAVGSRGDSAREIQSSPLGNFASNGSKYRKYLQGNVTPSNRPLRRRSMINGSNSQRDPAIGASSINMATVTTADNSDLGKKTIQPSPSPIPRNKSVSSGHSLSGRSAPQTPQITGRSSLKAAQLSQHSFPRMSPFLGDTKSKLRMTKVDSSASVETRCLKTRQPVGTDSHQKDSVPKRASVTSTKWDNRDGLVEDSTPIDKI